MNFPDTAFSFTLDAVCPVTGARAGTLHTPRGDIQTPVFMPVGTQATVKAMAPFELEEMGARIILAIPPSLSQARRGHRRRRRRAHGFMQWKRPILTDSGGFQVFSLSTLNRISDEGVWCRSHHDGTPHVMNPSGPCPYRNNSAATSPCASTSAPPGPAPGRRRKGRCGAPPSGPPGRRSPRPGMAGGAAAGPVRHRPGVRLGGPQAPLGGGHHSHGFPRYAVGGLSVGEPHGDMYRILDSLKGVLPSGKPRYLMGVGRPDNLVEGVARASTCSTASSPRETGETVPSSPPMVR